MSFIYFCHQMDLCMCPKKNPQTYTLNKKTELSYCFSVRPRTESFVRADEPHLTPEKRDKKEIKVPRLEKSNQKDEMASCTSTKTNFLSCSLNQCLPPHSCPERAVVAITLNKVIKWPCCGINGILASASILLSKASFC